MKKNIFAAFMLCVVLSIQAQKTIPVSGGEAIGIGGSSSYSVGQLMYTTSIGGGDTVTQGVQQSIEQSIVQIPLSNLGLTTVNLTAVTYPNPTSDYLTLKITESTLNNLSYELYNVHGKVISHRSILNMDTQIAMKQLAIGVYILRVSQNNQSLKIFKIIKK